MDRKAIVQRNHPVFSRIDERSPLSVGNGEFAFSADVTGLQSFPEAYEVPLGTQSNWGWHYTGRPELYTLEDVRFQPFETNGRKVMYPMKPEDRETPYHWLRQNPHRLQLGRISFRLLKKNGEIAQYDELEAIRQEMNLWEGIIYSRFMLEGVPVDVTTACHPGADLVAVKVNSHLLREQRLQVFMEFPSPDMVHTGWNQNTFPTWDKPERHHTELNTIDDRTVSLKRKMDEDGYEVIWRWSGGGAVNQSGPHEFTLNPSQNTESLEFTISFAPDSPAVCPAEETFAESCRHWESFWMSGGVIDFADSKDERAGELERRVVMSQFLTAVHCGGSMPPQETGYMYNSWFGKFHLEMHWWHSAHFALWGRSHLLSNSLDWYRTILSHATDIAKSQGYSGARWPKMVGIDGRQSPSAVAPGLIWQQPHPIAMAELCYKAEPNMSTLERYKEIVFATADFMVSYAVKEAGSEHYVLGPPLIPAQECHRMGDSMNPPYELEYWKYALEAAARWAERMNLPVNPLWTKVASSISKPVVQDGVYLAHARCPNTFTQYNRDHPSMLGALGILPGTLIDREIMRSTLHKVMDTWQWDTAWGWDFPMCAMTAARLGEGGLAVDLLMMDAVKNTYLPNGHNYQRPGLSAYLPGNGGLLTAIAMMASGWDGENNGRNPGFPTDGSWSVRWEGLKPWL